jgi:hypothetical protein
VVDTAGWRFRYAATAEVHKLRSASWAPEATVSLADPAAAQTLVRMSLLAQAALGADAYLVPGWMPESPEEDVRPAYERILATVEAFADVPAKPLILFVGGHTQGIEAVVSLLDSVPHFVSAVYVQLSPIAPAVDSPSKLESITSVYRHAADLGFQVVAGHGGAALPALRALGIDAADAGLASGETFDRARAKTSPRRGDANEDPGGGRPSRMYFSQIGRSLGAADVRRLLGNPAAAIELGGCRLPCHRFRSGDPLEQAREHSLWARVTDAQLVDSLPASMRSAAVHERLRNQRSVLSTINGALVAAGEAPLSAKPIDNHMTWMSRAAAARAVA